MTDGTAAFERMLQKYLSNQPVLIVDVGARGGLDARWSKFFSLIQVVGFEPDRLECKRLNESAQALPYKAKFFAHVLGRENASAVKFYVCRNPNYSSIYEPNLQFVRNFQAGASMEVEAIDTVDTVRLSDIAAKEHLQPDVIKIDVQGAELDVLMGGADLLPGVKLVELEVEFNPQYRNQPLFHDVDKFMHDAGWSLVGLRRTCWRRTGGLTPHVDGCGGQLIHGDALYLNLRFIDGMKDVGVEDLLKMLLVLSAYRQNDLVLSILSSNCPALKILSRDEQRLLEQQMVHYPSKIARVFRWVTSLVNQREKRRLVDLLQQGDAVDWHDPDFF